MSLLIQRKREMSRELSVSSEQFFAIAIALTAMLWNNHIYDYKKWTISRFYG